MYFTKTTYVGWSYKSVYQDGKNNNIISDSLVTESMDT